MADVHLFHGQLTADQKDAAVTRSGTATARRS